MASNDLALSWKDHHNVLISVFENLLEKKSLVDCTLAAGGEFLKAHKIVLSACSPYLETLLNQECDKHPIIFLRDVNFQDLKALVEFVYSGEIKIPENRLVEFLNIAEALQIKGLGGAQNETREKKQDAETLQQRKPVAKKRLHRDSNNSESNSHDRYDTSSSTLPARKVKRNKEGETKVSETNNIGASSQETIVAREDVQEEIPEIKMEEVNITSAGSPAVNVEQSIPDCVESEANELSELKPEFEQVTFTDDFTEDMLPEDDDATEAVVNPEHDETSNSYIYSGFSSEPFDTGGLAAQNQCVDAEGDQSEGNVGLVREWPSSSRESATYQQADCSGGNDEGKESTRSASQSLDDRLLLKLHQCSYCLKSYKCASALRTHVYTHTGERPFQCTLCSARFIQSGDLKRHFRIHTEEKPFQCKYCPARFNQSGNLTDHLRMHTGDRPFECSFCDQSFSQKRYLKTHIQAHHSGVS